MRAYLICTAVWLSGTLLLASAAQAQLQPVNPVVVDSTNRILGPLIGGNGQYALVAFRVNDLIFALKVRRNSFEGAEQVLFFTSADCSGTPYFGQDFTALPPPSAVVPPGNSVFVADPAGSVETIVVRSVLDEFGCAPQSPFTTRGLPAIFVIQLDSEFVPPITVQHAP